LFDRLSSSVMGWLESTKFVESTAY